MPSSLIRESRYDAETGTLSVWLVTNGKRYSCLACLRTPMALSRVPFRKGAFSTARSAGTLSFDRTRIAPSHLLQTVMVDHIWRFPPAMVRVSGPALRVARSFTVLCHRRAISGQSFLAPTALEGYERTDDSRRSRRARTLFGAALGLWARGGGTTARRTLGCPRGGAARPVSN